MLRINTYKSFGYPHLFQYKIVCRFYKIFSMIFKILKGSNKYGYNYSLFFLRRNSELQFLLPVKMSLMIRLRENKKYLDAVYKILLILPITSSYNKH